MNSCKTEISKASIIQLLDVLIASFLAEASQIQFDKDNLQQLYLMCLYGRILEVAVSILNLMKANDHAGIPILLRSQLEAFVDFANLVENKDFINTIISTFVYQKKRLYKNLRKHLDRSEILSATDNKIEKELGWHKRQSIGKRFENIKLEKTYGTAYFTLCNYAHNNLAMLFDRHIEEDQEEHKVVFFKEEPFTMFVRFAMTLGATLVDAHTILTNFFNKSPDDKTQAVCVRFSQLRNEAKELFVNED